MFGFGKKKKLEEEARQTIAEVQALVQPLDDEAIGELLDVAEWVRMSMMETKFGTEAKDILEQFFANPFSMSDDQLHGMRLWSKDLVKQFKAQSDLHRLAGLTIWICNGLCAAHPQFLPLGSALWKELSRGKNHTSDFDWQKYRISLSHLGVQETPKHD